MQHKGAQAHEVSTPPVEQGILYTISVWTVNVEGDQSTAPDTDTVTPAGRTTVPANITNLEATEYTTFVELEFDNVLGDGDTAHRIKRGSTSSTWATAADMDRTVFMNPSDRAESRVVWRDEDVASGDVRYHVKALSFEGLESATATSVDISIVTPKGSRGLERPRPATTIEEVEWLHANFFLMNLLNDECLGDVVYYNIGTNSQIWRTPLNITNSSGVINFVGVAHFVNAFTSGDLELGVRITLDGTVIFYQFNELAIGVSNEMHSMVPIGAILTRPDGTAGRRTGGLQFHPIPFNDSLKIEVWKYVSGGGSNTLETRVAWNHYLT